MPANPPAPSKGQDAPPAPPAKLVNTLVFNTSIKAQAIIRNVDTLPFIQTEGA